MKTLTSLAALAATLCIGACSSGVATPIPPTDGYIAGGGAAGGSTGTGATSGSGDTGPQGGGSTSTPPPSGTGSPAPTPDAGVITTVDAGSPGTPVQDSGSGYFIDTGTGPGTGTAPSGPLGSCTNPLCGTDGAECGCTATDSLGNTVQLGCQAGGQCGCFVNQQLDDDPFDENGACNDPVSTQQQFLQYCSCN